MSDFNRGEDAGSNGKMVRACEKEMHGCPQRGGVEGWLWMVSGKVEVDQRNIGKR